MKVLPKADEIQYLRLEFANIWIHFNSKYEAKTAFFSLMAFSYVKHLSLVLMDEALYAMSEKWETEIEIHSRLKIPT